MLFVIFWWKCYYWLIMDGLSIPNRPRGLRRHWGCSGISVGTLDIADAACGPRLPTIPTTNIISKTMKSMKINENQWKSMKINENQWKLMKINENQWETVDFYWFLITFKVQGQAPGPRRIAPATRDAPTLVPVRPPVWPETPRSVGDW